MFKSTLKQRAANRANAQNSTGPGATQGQAASRYNAAKHGIVAVHQIMFDESADDLAELAAEYHEHHSPANSKERFLVDTLVNNEWRLRRLRRVEAELWEHATNNFMAANTEVPACTSGDAFATDSATFERLQRVVNSCERAYHRALKELQLKVGQALSPANVPANVPANPDTPPQKSGPEPAAGPATPSQPEQSKPTSTSSASFRDNPKTHAPAPPFTGAGAASPASPAAPANPAESHPPAADRDPKPAASDR
jgi:hypothetical protein